MKSEGVWTIRLRRGISLDGDRTIRSRVRVVEPDQVAFDPGAVRIVPYESFREPDREPSTTLRAVPWDLVESVTFEPKP